MWCSSQKYSCPFQMANGFSMLNNPSLVIVTNGNCLLSSEHPRLHQGQQPFSSECCKSRHAGLPRSSLICSEPLSMLFIILSLVATLFTVFFFPTELFLCRTPNFHVHVGGIYRRTSSFAWFSEGHVFNFINMSKVSIQSLPQEWGFFFL